jgi:hypothetical protein
MTPKMVIGPLNIEGTRDANRGHPVPSETLLSLTISNALQSFSSRSCENTMLWSFLMMRFDIIGSMALWNFVSSIPGCASWLNLDEKGLSLADFLNRYFVPGQIRPRKDAQMTSFLVRNCSGLLDFELSESDMDLGRKSFFLLSIDRRSHRRLSMPSLRRISSSSRPRRSSAGSLSRH